MKFIKDIITTFKKTTTSKKLTALIVTFWFIAIIADVIIYLITGTTINAVVDYVNTAFLVILGSYFGKSMVENITKIKLNSTSTSDSTSTTTTDTTDNITTDTTVDTITESTTTQG
jgi:hypothetical protein